jgi:hypothetical protein
VAKSGGDELENLELLQWENNRRKGDTFINGEPKATFGLPRQDRQRIVSPS